MFVEKTSKSPNHGGVLDLRSGALQDVAVLRELCSKVERPITWLDGAGEDGGFAHVDGGVVGGVDVEDSCRSVRERPRAYYYLLKYYSLTAEVESSWKVIDKQRQTEWNDTRS